MFTTTSPISLKDNIYQVGEYKLYMDNSILNLISHLLSGQQNNSNNPNPNGQNFNNSAFQNYPREAFMQNGTTSAQNFNSLPNFQPQNNQSNGGLGNLLGLLSGNGNENNPLPLLLSMLGKNPSGLSGILEALSKKPAQEKDKDCNEDNEEIGDGSTEDEILL